MFSATPRSPRSVTTTSLINFAGIFLPVYTCHIVLANFAKLSFVNPLPFVSRNRCLSSGVALGPGLTPFVTPPPSWVATTCFCSSGRYLSKNVVRTGTNVLRGNAMQNACLRAPRLEFFWRGVLSTRCCLDNLNLNFAKSCAPTSSTATTFCLKNYPPVGGMSLQQSSALLLIQI